MKKRVFGRRFKRNSKERKALFRGLMRSLVLYGRIETTEEKAKAIKGEIEKFVTKAKNKGEQAKDLLVKDFSPEIADKIIRDVAPVFKDRSGGYTRILKIGRRIKDNAEMALLEWVEPVKGQVEEKVETVKKEEIKEKKKPVKKIGKKELKKEEKDAKADKANKS